MRTTREQITNAGSIDELVAEHMHGVTADSLPASTLAATKCLVLDTVGAAIAGTRAEGCQELLGLVERWGGAGESRLVASSQRVPAHHAALVNASMARALEIDDVHERALLHSTCGLVPVAMASVDIAPGPTGADLLAAVALGIDLSARIGLSPIVDVGKEHQPRPMSWTYQLGILVGALVAGKLRGYGPHDLRNVLGIAYSQCAGNNQCLLEGSLTVRVQQGLSASSALLAAALHDAGITGTLHSLDGTYGYFEAYHRGAFDPTAITDGLGERYEVEAVSIKPFPCCKFTHTAIAAALEVRLAPGFRHEDVEHVVAHVNNREYLDVVCQPEDPEERRLRLKGERGWVHAQFSLPYVIAVALVHGSVELAHFTDRARADPAVLRVMDLVRTVIDDDVGAEVRGRELPTPGLVDVHLASRTEPLRGFVRHPKGHPKNPMSFEEVTEKFLSVTELVEDRFPADRRHAIVDTVARLDELDDGRALMDAIHGDD